MGKRPGLALRLRGPGGLSRGAPVTHQPGLPPGPERWPPRTASSSGRGAPSCRGGEPRTLRGVGIGPRAFHILIPESRGPGAPPEAGGLESGWPILEQLSLRGAWPAWVWGAGWGLRRGTSAGRCPGTGCGAAELGELPLSAWPWRTTCTTASDFLQNSSGVTDSMGGCLRGGGPWPWSPFELPRGSSGLAWGRPAGV